MCGDDAWRALCWILGILAVLAVVGLVAIVRWML